MKNLKLSALAVLFSTGLFAQNFYITANAGYAFTVNGENGQYSNEYYTIIDNDITNEYTNEYTYSNVPFSLGKGFSFGGSVGYMFNENIGIDLAVSYLKGSEIIGIRDAYIHETKSNGDIYNRYNRDEISAYSQMTRIIPSFVISPGFDKFNPYSRIGVVLGFGTFIKETDITMKSTGTYWDNEDNTHYKEQYHGGMSFGFNAVIGLEYILNDKISVFGEASYLGMKYSPQKSTITEYTYNGEDQLPDMNTYSKEIEFYTENTVKRDETQPIDYDSPREMKSESFVFNSLGLNFGVKFSF